MANRWGHLVTFALIPTRPLSWPSQSNRVSCDSKNFGWYEFSEKRSWWFWRSRGFHNRNKYSTMLRCRKQDAIPTSPVIWENRRRYRRPSNVSHSTECSESQHSKLVSLGHGCSAIRKRTLASCEFGPSSENWTKSSATKNRHDHASRPEASLKTSITW